MLDPAPISEPAPPRNWASLVPGTRIIVVKLAPDGMEAARYPGEVVARHEPGDWVIVRASWTHRRIDLDGLSFVPGDELLEWFSPKHPFNAFAVFSPQGLFRGWYANVSLPAFLQPCDGPEDQDLPVLVWHDMYLDLVGLPDGSYALRDEEELQASSLGDQDPELYEAIRDAMEILRRRFSTQLPPFIAAANSAAMRRGAGRKSLVR
jgi:hypothetical protein